MGRTKGGKNKYWSKKEYDIFINDIDCYGKEGIEIISKDITTKTPKEIMDYNNAFWERINDLPKVQADDGQ